MKLVNMVLLLLIIQGTIVFYDAVYEAGDYRDVDVYDSSGGVLWSFATNPIDWNSTALLVAFLIIGGVTASFIIVGTFLNTPSDTAIFSTAFTLLIAAGAVPIISLYHVFDRNAAMFGCETIAIECIPGMLVWLVTGGIIAVFYVFSVLEWWSGRTMSSG